VSLYSSEVSYRTLSWRWCSNRGSSQRVRSVVQLCEAWRRAAKGRYEEQKQSYGMLKVGWYLGGAAKLVRAEAYLLGLCLTKRFSAIDTSHGSNMRCAEIVGLKW